MTQKAFPYSIIPLEPTVNEELVKEYQSNLLPCKKKKKKTLRILIISIFIVMTAGTVGFVQIGPKKYIFGSSYAKHAEYLYNFQARSDDIFIATHPRSGTTLMQEMVWLLAHDLDYDRANRESLLKRSLHLEYDTIFDIIFNHMQSSISIFFSFCTHTRDGMAHAVKLSGNPMKLKQVLDYAKPAYKVLPNFNSPRIIKTHLPFSLLSPSVMTTRARVIYIARNPKDMLISYYYLYRKISDLGFRSDFSRFFELFERDLRKFHK